MSANSPMDDAEKLSRRAADAAQSELEALKRQAASMADAAQEGLANAQARVEREVRANPVAALSLALGAGVALGLLIARR